MSPEGELGLSLVALAEIVPIRVTFSAPSRTRASGTLLTRYVTSGRSRSRKFADVPYRESESSLGSACGRTDPYTPAPLGST